MKISNHWPFWMGQFDEHVPYESLENSGPVEHQGSAFPHLTHFSYFVPLYLNGKWQGTPFLVKQAAAAIENQGTFQYYEFQILIWATTYDDLK